MRRHFRFFLCLAGAIWAAGRLGGELSERGRPFLENFGPGDYRGHQQVFDIAQSTAGFIYFANFGAVMEYDGSQWRGIAVPTSWIRELAADDKGRVWVAGVDEIGWCETGANGTTVYHSLADKLPPECRPLGTAWSVVVHGGATWFATDRFVLRWHEDHFERYAFPQSPQQRLRSGGRDLWLSRQGDGLYRWVEESWRLVSRAPELSRQPVSLVIDELPATVVGLVDGTLWTLDAAGAVQPFAPEAVTMLAETKLTGGARLHNGLLALTTHGLGVLVLNTDGHFVQRLGAEEGLPSSVVYSVTEDREGGVWVGTNMGAARVELGSPYTLFGREEGRGTAVLHYLKRSQGVFYAGSEEGLRQLVPARSGTAHFELVPGARSRVFALLAHEVGLLAGTDAGLGRVEDGEFRIEKPSALPVLGLGRSKTEPERIFVGFPESVSTYRRAPDGQWIDEGPIAAFAGEARTLVEDAEGNLWVGTTQRGFARITKSPGQRWQDAMVEYFRNGHGLPAEPGWVRVVDGPGGPWFSTAQGLFVFDAKAKSFRPAPAVAATRLTGKYSWPVANAATDEMWLQVANSGEPADLEQPEVGHLRRHADDQWDWQTLPARVLKQVGYFGVYEIMVEPDAVWLSGQSAVVRIDTAQLENVLPNVPPQLAWRRISRSDVGLLALAGEAPVLPYGTAPLVAEFSRPGFSAGDVTEYSYRVSGFDDAWSPWRASSRIEVTGLPAGSYVLEVRSNDTSVRAGETIRYAFRIRAPWYRSWPAIFLYVVGGVVTLLVLVRWRVAALRRAQVQLERLVTERTRELNTATREAEMASRAKTLFLASASHELRTPLHAILGYAQLLESDRTLSAGTRDRLQIVGASGRHLLRLINEVLDLSKIDAGKLELRIEPFSLPALLDDVVDAQASRAHAKGLSLRRPEVAALPETVLGDVSKLRQVLENLLGNAVKFTERGEVALQVIPGTSGRLRFEVSDTGPGIAAAELPRLFQPFHQATDPRTVNTERGTGLGLAISQRLIALMGGDVKVESEVGKGARFWFEISLPTQGAGAPASLSAAGTPREYRGKNRRVLVVDDIAVNRDLLRELLEPVGFVITTAASAEQALEALGRERFELMILDLRLPGMSGLELARHLRGQPATAALPILAASASTLGHDPGEALRAGCSDFIGKPFSAEELLAKLARLLDPEEAAAVRHSREPFIVTGRLEPVALQALHAAALEGDVLRVRDQIARLRAAGGGGPLLDEIERCAHAFDVDGVVAIAAACLKGAASPS